MQCPYCRHADTRVVDSRTADDGSSIRRRRECPECGARFNTFERAHLPVPPLEKSDGSTEAFDEEKLRRGMARALYKRPVSDERLQESIDRIVDKLRTFGERSVPARTLGEWVMEELREMDHVAYVRFASVYRQFNDAQAFREEIERLESSPSAELRRNQLPLIGEDDDSDASR
ncbi:transcriptional regulator NrdR [Algiphilus aromaticivorans]|uniref:transcriptional regulator NrdR n=1 Tax=Algiphilus aromaticivorans TaxID=382454 RepID=UPI0005C23778|nr:transcriptional regulator NrdR [Algiphilus aromaticivorans]